jgi:mono/diheme cytochrome c family protein
MKRYALIPALLAMAALPALADAAAGKAIFEKSCKGCHGATGQGNPAVAKMMKVQMHSLGSKEVQAKSDADLTQVVMKGAGKMKPVASVTAGQAADVISFVRTLKQ